MRVPGEAHHAYLGQVAAAVAIKPVLFYGRRSLLRRGMGRRSVSASPTFGRGLRSGLSHAVLVSGDYLGDDDFVMYLGDNFVVGGITALAEEFRTHRPGSRIMPTPVPDPREFGVAELDDSERVVGLEEKLQQPRSDLARVSVYIFGISVHRPSGT